MLWTGARRNCFELQSAKCCSTEYEDLRAYTSSAPLDSSAFSEAETFGAFTVCLRIRRGEADARFVIQLLQTLPYRIRVANLLAGYSINNLRPGDVAGMLFAMAPLAEQTGIADALADMGAELAARDARREKTRQLKQGMMQSLRTGRIRLT